MQHVAADLADTHAATEAARGVDTIIYALGVPYTAFDLYPKLMRTTVDAAVAGKNLPTDLSSDCSKRHAPGRPAQN